MGDYDAIVIGAGHNGLTAAVVMAREGLRVLCLEKNHYVGGMAATTELIKGYRFEIAGSVLFPIMPPTMRSPPPALFSRRSSEAE